jgi:tetratricopeptide (TPR) repeat protein
VPFKAYSCQFMLTPSTARSDSEDPAQGSRLDSWKEIASYLRRAERTVKRWETDRGLPVHRVPGGGRGSVYAYTAELSEWLKSASERPLEESPDDPEEVDQEELADTNPAADTPSNNPLPQPAPAPRLGAKPNLLLAVAGLLLLFTAGMALNGTGFRARGFHFAVAPASRLAGKPANPATPSPVSDSERQLARDLYLKGRYQWNQRTPDSLNRALDSFTQSIVHDPGNAQAYVGLADTYDLLREYSTMPESDAYPRAIAAAKRAVELDDSLGEAHRALAFAEFYGNWNFVEAEKEFLRAIQLNPDDPVARRWYANAFAVPGRYSESLAQISKAQELDPSSHATLSDKGLMLVHSGKEEEGISLLNEVERTDPKFLSPHVYLMHIGFELRNYPMYLAEGQKAAEISGDPMLNDMIAAARAGYEHRGEHGLLNNLYARQEEYYLAGKLWGTLLAKTCIRMGRKQEALQLLEDGYAHRDSRVLWCLTHPDLLSLKDEPRYQALVKKISFPGSKSAPPGAPSAIDTSPLRASK